MHQDIRHALTILATSHFREMVDFYKAAFGWELAVETPVYVEFLLPGAQRIGIYEREAFGRNTGRAPATTTHGELAPTELYFYADDPEAAMTRLRAAGARQLSAYAMRPWGDGAGYFADLEGNVLVVAHRAETAMNA